MVPNSNVLSLFFLTRLLVSTACFGLAGFGQTPILVPISRQNVGLPTFFRGAGWAPGPDRSLVRTVDEGRTWTPVSAMLNGRAVRDINGAYFMSADEAWIRVPDDPGNPVSMTTLIVTHDGGMTWVVAPSPPSEWSGESLFSLNAGKSVWLGGQKFLAGNPIDDADCPQRIRDQRTVPVVFSLQGFHSGWEEQTFPSEPSCPVTMLKFADARQGIAISGSYVFDTSDGGRRWNRSTIDGSNASKTPSRPVSLSLAGKQAWIGCEGGQILTSLDLGAHWRSVASPGSDGSGAAGGFGTWGAVFFIGPRVGFTLGVSGDLFYSRDTGTTWHVIKAPERLIGLTCSDRHCWVTSAATLYSLEQ